jgi:hypothetical protein
MEIEITKYENQKEETEYLKIENYTKISSPKSLLLVTEYGSTENGNIINHIDIKKIQFLASCKTKFENEILVAFYVNEEGSLLGHIISELQQNYFSHKGYLVDYKAYLEICDLTEESKLSFIEYFEQIKNSYIGPNTISKFKDKYYNFTQQQKEMWDLVNS